MKKLLNSTGKGGCVQNSRMKVLAAFAMILAIGMVFSGCGSSSKPSITVAVSPGSSTVLEGKTQAFTVTLTNDSAAKGVNWMLTCSVSNCGALSGVTTTSVTYTAPGPVASNLTVTLTATSVADTTKTGTATITVPAITVAAAPTSATVNAGSSTMITPTVTNDPSATPSVTWAVTCTTAPCGSVSPVSTASGTATTYTAPTTAPVSNLTVTITASSATDTTKSASSTITVPAISVAISPLTPTVQAGKTQVFTSTVNGTSNQSVTWTLTCGVASCGSLSSNTSNPTTYTAPGPPASSLTVTITARAMADATKSASTSITVPAITVSVSPNSASVVVSTTQNFTATVTNDPSATPSVTWTLSGTGCTGAACGTISSASSASGTPIVYTAPATVPTPATVTLTATSGTDGTKTATATITVTLAPPIAVSVSPSAASVAVNGTQTFTATVTNDSANAGVTWTLSGTGCAGATCGTLSATSSASGAPITYTAPASVPTPATVTITATSVTDTTKSASATITVSATGNNSKLNGNYAFLFNGWNSQGLNVVAGDFVADGNGNISNGLADINTTSGPKLNQSFTGTYSIASDNLGTVTLNLVGGVTTTLAIAVQAGGDAKVIEFDDTTGTGTRGSGVFKKQDTTAFSTAKITGHYAFGSVGVDSTAKRLGVAGAFQADGAGNITNGLLDGDDNGGLLSSATFSGPYSVAASGRGTFSPTITGQGTSNFSFYVVSATELLFMQIDSIPAGKSMTSGSILQQTGGGSFTNASLNGTSVIENSALGGGTTPETLVGLFTSNGTGTFSLSADDNTGGTITTMSASGTYSVASNGRVTLTALSGKSPVLYLVSQNEAFLIGTDGGVSFGMFEPQSPGPFSNSSISGTYAGGSITPVGSNVSDEVDEFVVTSAGNFSVTSDNSSGGGLTSNKMQSGTYSVAANGRTTATVTGQTGSVFLYIVSPTKAVGFATDTSPKLVVFEQ
jgi:hypothetical protein